LKTEQQRHLLDQPSFKEDDFDLLIRQKVLLELCPCSQGNTISGFICVANVAFHKMVVVRAMHNPSEVMSGARKVWGTLSSASHFAVRNTISQLTKLPWVSGSSSLCIRRKYAHHARKSKWWFVLHSGETNMKALESVWEMVKLQTGLHGGV